MARAYNIFVVSRHSTPIAAFSVKHELQAWCETHQSLFQLCQIHSVRDGGDEVFVIRGAEYRELFGRDVTE